MIECKDPDNSWIALLVATLVLWWRNFLFSLANGLINKLLSMIGRRFIKSEDRMLEGKELEGKIGDSGEYSVDVDAKGVVVVLIKAEKAFEGGKASSVNSVEFNLLSLLAKAAAKSKATWDDEAIAKIQALLGLIP